MNDGQTTRTATPHFHAAPHKTIPYPYHIIPVSVKNITPFG